jgi:enoyl-CoA hydratase/carnithine racemase
MSDVEEELIVTRDEGVLVARLNRPERRNALSGGLLSRLGATFIEAEEDPEIRVLILTATGDRAFCSGMDLADFASGAGTSAPKEHMAAFGRMTQGRLRIPVIGAANATAVGGGLELLLGCDVLVASSGAKFGLPEVKRGLYAAGGGTNLSLRIPLNLALEMIMTGDLIDAARAYEIGLVNRVVEPDELMAVAMDYAARIAANGPLGVAASKELTRLAQVDQEAKAERETELQKVVFASEDAREGATAFVEKRAPVWKGR